MLRGIKFGDNRTLYIQEEGNIDILLNNGEARDVKNVLYVPRLKKSNFCVFNDKPRLKGRIQQWMMPHPREQEL
jgi:hypothetical protein